MTTVRVPAKLNLTLAVQFRRPDGFHEIESLVVAVTLYDELTIASRQEPGIELTCDQRNLPCDSRNLVYRAAARLAEQAGIQPAVRLALRKRIPVGAGLGGGSSDAAATLLALNRWWKLDWPVDRLASLGAAIGSDVALFLYPPASIVRSRGERVEPVSFPWPGWVALLLPAIPIATPEVYARWRPGETPPSAAAVLAARTAPAARLAPLLGNMLERPAFAFAPALAALHQRAQALCPHALRLSGTGSALFALFDGRADALAFTNRVQQQLGLQTRLVQCLPSTTADP